MFELRVLSGLHEGAALPLIGDVWMIGSDSAQDLTLYDAGIASLHCRLQRLNDAWQVTAVNGVVCNEQGQAQALTELTPNHSFTLGSVWLCLAHADMAWSDMAACAVIAAEEDPAPAEPANAAPHQKKSWRSRVFNRANSVLIGLLIGIAGSAWSLSGGPSPEKIHIEVKAAQVVPPPAHPANNRLVLSSVDDAKNRLATMLSDRLLSDLTVLMTPDGLTINGSLQDESRLLYQRMLQQFNERYQSPVALIDNVSTSGNGLPFTIVHIMSGPQAHLVTGEGRRMYIGDEYQGLRLTRIDDQRIEFEGDRRYEVRW